MARIVHRESLLKALEDLAPGLAAKEVVEQSSDFVFDGKWILTYNDQVACRVPNKAPDGSPMLDLTGAIPAAKFTAILQKLQEEQLEAEVQDNTLVLKGKSRKFGVFMSTEILLDVSSIDKPGKWQKLPDGFEEAVSMVAACAGKDESLFWTTCVHITKDHIEAADRFQICRYMVGLDVQRPLLIKSEVLKAVVARGPTKYSHTGNWMHFKTASGLIMSCRLYEDDFADVTPYLAVTGTKTSFPKGLVAAIDKANVFSSENSSDNQIRVALRRGKLQVRGEGATGWFQEVKKINYTGQSMAFFIAPELLVKLTEDHNECQVTPEALKVDGGNFVYVSSLETVED